MAEQLPIKHCTWIICGGQDFDDKEAFDASMSVATELRGHLPACVAHGDGKSGVDVLAGAWARTHGLDVAVMRRGAPPYVELFRRRWPELVIAFPGGHGSDELSAKVRATGVDVLQVGLRG